MINYTYEDFNLDVKVLAKDIKDNYNPDVLLSIARGGMTLGHFLSELLQTRDLYSLNSIHYEETNKLDSIDIFNIPDLSKKRKVLLVDDIIDSGETMIEIKRVLQKKYPHLILKVATIFYKENALMTPDFSVKHADDWIEFFWEYYNK